MYTYYTVHPTNTDRYNSSSVVILQFFGVDVFFHVPITRPIKCLLFYKPPQLVWFSSKLVNYHKLLVKFQ